MLSVTTNQVKDLMRELPGNVKAGSILLVGCSTSEIMGMTKGSLNNIDLAYAILDTIEGYVLHKGLLLAVLCEDGSVLMMRMHAAKAGVNTCGSLPRATGCFANAFLQYGDVVTALGVTPDYGMDIGGYGVDRFFDKIVGKSHRIGSTVGMILRR